MLEQNDLKAIFYSPIKFKRFEILYTNRSLKGLGLGCWWWWQPDAIMFCEKPTEKREKSPCRCKNCVLRHSDFLPWPEPIGFTSDRKTDKDNNNHISTLQSVESVVTISDVNERHTTNHYKNHQSNPDEIAYTPNRSGVSSPVNDGASSPTQRGGTTPAPQGGKGGNSPSRVTAQPQAQPTILLIVVKWVIGASTLKAIRK